MFRGYRLIVSVTAALPINPQDGEAVYNFRGSISSGHFLGQLFRTLNQVLNPPPETSPSDQSGSSDNIIAEVDHASSTSTSRDSNDDEESVESRSKKKDEIALEEVEKKSKLELSQQGSDDEKHELYKNNDDLSLPNEEKVLQSLEGAQPSCQSSSQGKSFK